MAALCADGITESSSCFVGLGGDIQAETRGITTTCDPADERIWLALGSQMLVAAAALGMVGSRPARGDCTADVNVGAPRESCCGPAGSADVLGVPKRRLCGRISATTSRNSDDTSHARGELNDSCSAMDGVPRSLSLGVPRSLRPGIGEKSDDDDDGSDSAAPECRRDSVSEYVNEFTLRCESTMPQPSTVPLAALVDCALELDSGAKAVPCSPTLEAGEMPSSVTLWHVRSSSVSKLCMSNVCSLCHFQMLWSRS